MLKSLKFVSVFFFILFFVISCDEEDNTIQPDYNLESIYPLVAGTELNYKRTYYADSAIMYVEEVRIKYLDEIEYESRPAIRYSTETREWENPDIQWSDPLIGYLSLDEDTLFFSSGSIWNINNSISRINYAQPGDTLFNSTSGKWIFESDSEEIENDFNSYQSCIYTRFLATPDELMTVPSEYFYYKEEIGLVYYRQVSSSFDVSTVLVQELVSADIPLE